MADVRPIFHILRDVVNHKVQESTARANNAESATIQQLQKIESANILTQSPCTYCLAEAELQTLKHHETLKETNVNDILAEYDAGAYAAEFYQLYNELILAPECTRLYSELDLCNPGSKNWRKTNEAIWNLENEFATDVRRAVQLMRAVGDFEKRHRIHKDAVLKLARRISEAREKFK